MMTLHDFKRLTYGTQLTYVMREGVYLARRWDDSQSITLHQMPSGFFVEVNYDTALDKITHICAFEAGGEDDRLPDYAMFVKLPDWMPEAE